MAIASKSKARGSAKPKDKFDPAGKVVVVGNLKGGCGKSTIAFNLAVWLASAGDTPLLVDLDPQKTLSDLVSVREDIEATPQIASPVDALPASADGRRVLVDFGASDFARMAQVIPRADLILVPVLPSQADVWATQRYLILVLTRRKPGARIIFFVNRADPSKHPAKPVRPWPLSRRWRECAKTPPCYPRSFAAASLIVVASAKGLAFSK